MYVSYRGEIRLRSFGDGGELFMMKQRNSKSSSMDVRKFKDQKSFLNEAWGTE